jgi:hypothetical protein
MADNRGRETTELLMAWRRSSRETGDLDDKDALVRVNGLFVSTS